MTDCRLGATTWPMAGRKVLALGSKLECQINYSVFYGQ